MGDHEPQAFDSISSSIRKRRKREKEKKKEKMDGYGVETQRLFLS